MLFSIVHEYMIMIFEPEIILEDWSLCLRSFKNIVWISTWIFDGIDSLGSLGPL